MSKLTCKCPGCQSTSFCDAHIIPAGFARTLSEPSGHNIALSAMGSKRAKEQHGYFDPAILCRTCDGLLGKFDEYAIDFCKTLQMTSTLRTGEAYTKAHFKGEQFAKFALAVIWRASISDRPEWKQISLGRYEAVIAGILFGESELHAAGDLEVAMFRFTSPDHDARRFIYQPLKLRSGDLNMFSFGAGGFQILVKADRRPIHRFLRTSVINSATRLTCYTLRFEETAEHDYMLGVGEIDRSRMRSKRER